MKRLPGSNLGTLLGFLFFIGITFLSKGTAWAERELVIGHSFRGYFEKALEKHVKKFMQKYPEIHVKLAYQGDYTTALDNFRRTTLKRVHLIQISEYQSATMRKHQKLYVPLAKLLPLSQSDFPPYLEMYADRDGHMLSLPFNVSTGVMFYNKTAFKEAGLNPNQPPKTWDELESYCRTLVRKGKHGFSTAWPAAYILEGYAFVNGIPLALPANGLKGEDVTLSFTDPRLVKRLERFAEWRMKGLYLYGGVSSTADSLFSNQQVSIYLQGVNHYFLFKEPCPFEIGVAPLPVDDLGKSYYTGKIGGGSFWVVSGHSDKVYEDLKLFLAYLSSVEAQLDWFRETYYLPVTHEALRQFFANPRFADPTNPGRIALEQLQCSTSEYSKGLSVKNYARIRDFLVERIARVLSGEKAAIEALKEAEEQGNLWLKETIEED